MGSSSSATPRDHSLPDQCATLTLALQRRQILAAEALAECDIAFVRRTVTVRQQELAVLHAAWLAFQQPVRA